MKKLILLLFIPLVFACSLSNAELEEWVVESMTETFKETSGLEDAEILEFTLVHKGGNEYVGLLTINQRNIFTDDMMEMKYEVEVIYDGENVKWQIQD